MTADAIQALKNDVSAMELQDEQDFLRWLPLAARLASLGYSHELDDWPKRFEPFRDSYQFHELLNQRAREGVDELFGCEGEDLALALIATQDFFSFVEHNRFPVDKIAVLSLQSWAEESIDLPLDYEAASRIRMWLKTFPIAENDRLPAIDSPVTDPEKRLLALTAPALELTEAMWPAAKEIESRKSDLVLLDEEGPSKERMDNWERKFVGELSGGERVVVTRELNDKWELTVTVKSSADLDFVRLSTVKMNPEPGLPGYHSLKMQAMTSNLRERLLAAPLVIAFDSNRRLVLS